MKILIAVHHFPPHFTGGAEMETLHIASALQARGHSVLVVCIENAEKSDAHNISEVEENYQNIPVRRLSFNRYSGPDPSRYEYDNLWIGEYFDRLFDEFQPDIFHLVSGYLMSGRPVWVAHDHGIPVVITLEDFWFLCPRITMLRNDGLLNQLPLDPFTCASCISEDRRRFQILDKLAPDLMQTYWHLQKTKAQSIQTRSEFLMETLHKADLIIGRSKFLCSTYLQAGAPSDKVIFSRQGLDFPYLNPLDDRITAQSTLKVGYLGQIASHKGVHVLLEAARYISNPQLEVEIYGNFDRFPSYSAKLIRMTQDDRRLTLAGAYHGYEGEIRVLRNLDVIVVPSLWYENSPNVILEAFAQRTPVVASNMGGMAELVQHEVNGLVFQVGDAKDLAHQFQRLMDEPALLPDLRSGIGPIKTISQEIDELEVAYQNLLIRTNSSIRIQQQIEG